MVGRIRLYVSNFYCVSLADLAIMSCHFGLLAPKIQGRNQILSGIGVAVISPNLSQSWQQRLINERI